MKTNVKIGESYANERDSGPRVPVFPASEAARLVGSTPAVRYATWDDHRREIRLTAEDARARRAR